MYKIVLLTTDSQLKDQIENMVLQFYEELTFHQFDEVEKALEFIHYEIPNLIILNFADEKIDMDKTLDIINEDLWLNNGGLIAIHKNTGENDFLENHTSVNIISAIHYRELERRLMSVIKIGLKNDKLVFQRENPGNLSTQIDGRYSLENSAFDINVYANLISFYLYNSNLINSEQRNGVRMALVEMLLNAIEHGNCKISFDEKTKAMMDGKSMIDVIDEKMRDPEIRKKRIILTFSILPNKSIFSIEDEGDGFDWRKRQKLLSQEDNETLAHGRGIFLSANIVKNLTYNDKGNKVTFEIFHQEKRSNFRPRLFKGKNEISYNEGDIIFKRGEISNYLNYIVSGTYNVLDANGNIFAKLDPNDIFIGEMAFLLGDQRTATVQAETNGVLISLSKDEFVSRIKQYPYYGIFLSRLLAQRIRNLTNKKYHWEKASLQKYIDIAIDLYKEEKLQAAINELKLADTYYKNNDKILYLLIKILAKSKKYEEALNYIEKYELFHPNDKKTKIIKAYCYYNTQEYIKTMNLCKEIIKEKLTSSKEAQKILCKCYKKVNDKKNYTLCLEELNKL